MMARQILFRGKDIKSGKWRVGRGTLAIIWRNALPV